MTRANFLRGPEREEVTLLRSKYHDLLSDVFRQAGILCADRFEAARKAFELVGESAPHR